MKFIEISEGVCIRKDDICVITKDGDGSKITTDNGTYRTKYPYETLKSILESDNDVGSRISPTGVKKWGFDGQYFAG